MMNSSNRAVACAVLATLGAAPRAPAQADPGPLMSFGILTDVRYADKASAAGLHHRAAFHRLKDCIADFNRRELHFVVQLGDLIENDPSDLDTVLRQWRKVKTFGMVDQQNFHVLGDRDLTGISNDKQRFELGHRLRTNLGYYGIPGRGWQFIVLDGTPKRGLGRRQRTWLRDALGHATERGSKTVIFCHFPILAEAASREHLLPGHREVLALIESFPCVFGWFAGHHLEAGHATRNGIHHVTLQALATAPEKNAYGIVDAFDDRLELRGVGRQPSLTLRATDRRLPALARAAVETIDDPADPFAIPAVDVTAGKALRLTVRDGQPFRFHKPAGSHSLAIARYLSPVEGRLKLSTALDGMLVSPLATGVVDLELAVIGADGSHATAPVRLEIRARGATGPMFIQQGSHEIIVRQGETFRVRTGNYGSVVGYRAKDKGLAVLQTRRISAAERKRDPELGAFLDEGHGDTNGVSVRALEIGVHKLVQLFGKRGEKTTAGEIPVRVCPVAAVGPLTVQLLGATAYNDFHSLPKSLLCIVALRIENPRAGVETLKVVELVQRTVDGGDPLVRRVKMDRELRVPGSTTKEFDVRPPKIEGEKWNDRRIAVTITMVREGRRSELTSWAAKVGMVH